MVNIEIMNTEAGTLIRLKGEDFTASDVIEGLALGSVGTLIEIAKDKESFGELTLEGLVKVFQNIFNEEIEEALAEDEGGR